MTHHPLPRFLLRRLLSGVLLVVLVSSAALLLAYLAPGEEAFSTNPSATAAERQALGYDQPFVRQYAAWLTRVGRLDFGESLAFRRPVSTLLRQRTVNTLILGLSAIALATLLGVPAGVLTGSRRGPAAALIRATSVMLLSVPSLVMSVVLLILASWTGWLPVGGFADAPASAGLPERLLGGARYLLLPSLALALPLAATIERLQSQAMEQALAEPCIAAAQARGIDRRRIVWRHALRLSLTPVLAIYGVIIGSALGGSFAVESVMLWPGLGGLMYQALTARDINLVAGCAAVGSTLLAAGIFVSDLALLAVDPRLESHR